MLRIVAGDHPVIFDIELFLRARPVFAFDDVVSLLPYAIDIALLDRVSLEDIDSHSLPL